MPLFRKITKTREVRYVHNKPNNQIPHQSEWNEIIEENEYLSEVNEDLRAKVIVLEFFLTIAGITLGVYLNKTYHWF